MTEFEWGYILGFLSGRCSFTYNGGPCIRVQLKKNSCILDFLKQGLGGSISNNVWVLRGKELREVIPILDKNMKQCPNRDKFIQWKSKWSL